MTDEQLIILTRIDTNVQALMISQDDQEIRLRKLERFKNWLAGILAVVGSGLGIHNTVQS